LTSLPALLGRLVAILQTHSMCEKVAVVETKEFSPDQFFFKVRAALGGEVRFQVRIYYNRGHIDYAYQLFTDVPLLRWDNADKKHPRKSSAIWRLTRIITTMSRDMCTPRL